MVESLNITITPSITNEVPFKNLQDFSEGRYSVVKLFGDSFVVKEGRTHWEPGSLAGTNPLNDELRIVSDTRDMVNNFKEFIPPTQLVKGKNEKGEIIIYIVQEKVTGNRLDELEYSKELANELKVFLDKVTDNYIQHLSLIPGEKEPQSFFPDLNIKNFILGTTLHNPQAKLYFVDTFPIARGETPNFVATKGIPTLMSRWPASWQKFMKQYAETFTARISNLS